MDAKVTENTLPVKGFPTHGLVPDPRDKRAF